MSKNLNDLDILTQFEMMVKDTENENTRAEEEQPKPEK